MSRLPISLLVLSIFASQTEAAWKPAATATRCTLTAVDFADSHNGFAVGEGCVLSSSDGGATWKNVATRIDDALRATHAVGANELYVAQSGLYRSLDGGHRWKESGHLSRYPGSIFALHFEGAEHIVLIKGGNLWFSDDGGDSYRLGLRGDDGFAPDQLAFPEPTIGYATGGSTHDDLSFGVVLKTVDGGRTWTERTPPEIAEVVAADFSDADRGLLITFDNRVWRTDDGGRHWRTLPSDLPPLDLVADLRYGGGEHWYAVTYNGRILESRDGGGRWDVTYADPQQRSFNQVTLVAGQGLALGYNGLIVREVP